MNTESAGLLIRSWSVVLNDPDRAADCFHRHLRGLNPQLAALILEHGLGRSDFLQKGLAILISGAADLADFRPIFASMRERLLHYGIRQAELDVILESLLFTLKSTAGSAFTAEAEAAWRQSFTGLVHAILPRPTGRILVVDDEEVLRQSISSLLSVEYAVETAADGEEAMRMIHESAPDLVLLDLLMPGLDGLEVCRRIKKDASLGFIPVLILTAAANPETMERAMAAGADDFIDKPSSCIELRLRVQSMMRIRRQYDELNRLMALREDMIQMLIHDMRSPLQIIEALGDLLFVDNSLLESTRQDIAGIRAQSQRLRNFLDEILLVAKMENNSLSLNLKPTRIDQLLTRTMETWRPLAAPRNITLRLETPGEITRWVDAALFTRLADNLISNAIKFSPRGMQVAIRCVGDPWKKDGPFSLEVEDQGPGIPEEARSRLFEKFAVVEHHRKGLRQIGLGLTFCRLAAEAHGGSIAYKPRPSGALFVVQFNS